MSEMVERVALAMQAGIEGPPGDFEHMDPRPHQSYVKAARLAIEAMREPTRDMVDAAWRADPNVNEQFSPNLPDATGGTVGFVLEYDNQAANVIVAIHYAMIDAALKEPAKAAS